MAQVIKSSILLSISRELKSPVVWPVKSAEWTGFTQTFSMSQFKIEETCLPDLTDLRVRGET